MIQVFTAPENYVKPLKVFLGGTIDKGKSVDWQQEVISILNKAANVPIIVFNPRRPTFDKNEPFELVQEQIDWEQRHLDEADIIVMNILPDSKSPISLLELGLYAKTGKLKVFCSPDFYRYENVKMTCHKYKVDIFPFNGSLDIASVITQLDRNKL